LYRWSRARGPAYDLDRHRTADDRAVEALVASVSEPCTAQQLACGLGWTLNRTVGALRRLEASRANTGQILTRLGHHSDALGPRPRLVELVGLHSLGKPVAGRRGHGPLDQHAAPFLVESACDETHGTTARAPAACATTTRRSTSPLLQCCTARSPARSKSAPVKLSATPQTALRLTD
jgi:hypothetical protein